MTEVPFLTLLPQQGLFLFLICYFYFCAFFVLVFFIECLNIWWGLDTNTFSEGVHGNVSGTLNLPRAPWLRKPHLRCQSFITKERKKKHPWKILGFLYSNHRDVRKKKPFNFFFKLLFLGGVCSVVCAKARFRSLTFSQGFFFFEEKMTCLQMFSQVIIFK